jgi:hypothetical protein
MSRMGGTAAQASLFAMAAENAGSLGERAEDLLSRSSPEHLQILTRYAGLVRQEGRISVNMKQTTISSFFSLRQHLNMYESVRWLADLSSRPAEEILRERLKAFYDRRIAFDHHFENGEDFRYGALNIGGLGSWSYGEYCVVLHQNVSGRPEVAYLKSDSLTTYMLPGPAVDEESLRQDTAPHNHCHWLALLKHAKELPLVEDHLWAELLCSDRGYVEVIFTGDLTPDEIEAIRLPRPQYDLRFRLAFESFRSPLSDADSFLAEEFRTTLVHLKQKNVPLEVI